MRVLSLFSGIGLLDLGLAWAGMQTVGLCEIEPYCREVLRKHWPGVPIWSDVREVTGDAVRERCGAVDLVAGGFPCQPRSVAGKRKGQEDERHLWPEFALVVREVRPRWVLGENVPGIRATAADEVLADLEALGYSCWPLVVGADDCGAPHRRKRVWFIAHREGGRDRGLLADASGSGVREQRLRAGRDWPAQAEPGGRGEALEHAAGAGLRAGREFQASSPHPPDPTLLRGWPARPGEQQHEWEAPRLVESGMGGESDGGARRLAGRDRRAAIKALGNGVVPQVVAEVGRAIMAVEASMGDAA